MRRNRNICVIRHARLLLAVAVAMAAAPLALRAAGPSKIIGVSLPEVQGGFFTSMVYGIQEQAKEDGYAVHILSAGGYGNVSTQVSQLENLISQKVPIILVDPSDPTVTKRALKQAVAAGIVTFGAGDPAPGAMGAVTASHCTVGKDMAVGAKTLMPHGGTIAILAGPAGAHWSTRRLQCFKEEIRGSGIKIVAEQTSAPSVAAGLSIATDFLERFPKVDVIYGADDTVGNGAAKAVQAAKLCGKVKVLTAVLGAQSEQLLRDGCISYDVALQPVLIGRDAVKIAVQTLNGHKPAQTEVNIPNVAITPANIGTVDKSTLQAPKGWRPSMR